MPSSSSFSSAITSWIKLAECGSSSAIISMDSLRSETIYSVGCSFSIFTPSELFLLIFAIIYSSKTSSFKIGNSC